MLPNFIPVRNFQLCYCLFIFLMLSFFRLCIFKVCFSTEACHVNHLSKCQHFLLPSGCISVRSAASPQELLPVVGVSAQAGKMEFCHPVGAAGHWGRGREESGTLAAVKASCSCSTDAVKMSQMSPSLASADVFRRVHLENLCHFLACIVILFKKDWLCKNLKINLNVPGKLLANISSCRKFAST